MANTIYFAESALLTQGWAQNVRLMVDDQGRIAHVAANGPGPAPQDTVLAGPVLPGMANVHSHAFQRAIAGLSEPYGAVADDFWSWRQIMYRFVERLTPDQIEAIAAHLYIEMLKAGYTAVGEFQYLHNDPTGAAYREKAELSLRHHQAARRAGIGLTLLPVLYRHGNFGGADPTPGQRRFIMQTEDYLQMIADLVTGLAADPLTVVGLAPHSLRAVSIPDMQQITDARARQWPETPIHIHLAEQEREVADCLAQHRQRPGELLLEHAAIDRRWCLIHATHLSVTEILDFAAHGAVAGLCPTTEANLGDGIFNLPEWLQRGGIIGMGSDSHIQIDPFAEIMALDYSQRLSQRRRNSLGDWAGSDSPGLFLLQKMMRGGAQALGQPIGSIEAGNRADWVVLNRDALAAGADRRHYADSIIYARRAHPVRDVMVGGVWVVREGRHEWEQASKEAAYEAVGAVLRA